LSNYSRKTKSQYNEKTIAFLLVRIFPFCHLFKRFLQGRFLARIASGKPNVQKQQVAAETKEVKSSEAQVAEAK
jgi:hypothetical protein